MSIIHDAIITSILAKALESLPDAALDSAAAREAVYPKAARPAVIPGMFQFFDADALHAERMRRSLRVGRGFERQQKEAA